MTINSLTDEIIEGTLRDVANQYRAQMIAYYDRNYKELEGEVFNSDADIKRYWPVKYNEGAEAYNERVKIWTQLPKIIVNRIVSIMLSGDVRREWVSVEGTDTKDADLANELNTICDEENNWEAKASWVYYYALGIGEVALWPEFRRFNTATGEPYAISNGGQGIPIWSYWFPWFVEPIVLASYAEEVIGAAKIIYTDGQLATPLLTQAITGGKQKVITQAYLSPAYNKMSGDKVSNGFYRSWVNGIEEYQLDERGNPDKSWSTNNQYECNPVIFFRGSDPDETQYRGKSYVDKFRRLSIEHCRFISSIGQAIEVLPTIWEYTGDQKNIDKIVIRSNAIVQIPENGKFGQSVRELDLTEDWKFINYLEKTISLLAVIPAEVWDNLGSAGKVESFVALRLTWQPMADMIHSVREQLEVHEKEKMRVTVRMYNTFNKNKQIDLNKIRPEVSYNENVIPIDEAKEILNDLSLYDKGVKSLSDLVMKYNPKFTTQEQADAFIAEQKASAPPPVQSGITVRPRNASVVTQ
jgi:hypothetical protein